MSHTHRVPMATQPQYKSICVYFHCSLPFLHSQSGKKNPTVYRADRLLLGYKFCTSTTTKKNPYPERCKVYWLKESKMALSSFNKLSFLHTLQTVSKRSDQQDCAQLPLLHCITALLLFGIILDKACVLTICRLYSTIRDQSNQ